MRTRLEAGEGVTLSIKTELDPLIEPLGISKSTKVGTRTRLCTVAFRLVMVALKFATVAVRLVNVVLWFVVVVVKLAMELLIALSLRSTLPRRLS